jgi:hypothetical protein
VEENLPFELPLKGFDSLLIPSIVRRLARELGYSLPKGTRVRNIYCAADGRKKLTIREIAQRFVATYPPEASKV